jgi:hypothetical protein
VFVGVTVILAVLAPVLQLYVLAPLAVKILFCPTQIFCGEAVTVRDGDGVTVINTEAEAVHPCESVVVTVYVVVLDGEAIGLEIFGLDSPVVGDHE